ncbi:uncharacterized [Tachysurus ichikawai]
MKTDGVSVAENESHSTPRVQHGAVRHSGFVSRMAQLLLLWDATIGERPALNQSLLHCHTLQLSEDLPS